MRSRTVVTSPFRIASATKRPPAATGLNSGAKVLFAGRTAKSSRKASVDQEEIVTAEIDWERVNEHRTHWPFLRDRRIDAYAGLEQRLLD